MLLQCSGAVLLLAAAAAVGPAAAPAGEIAAAPAASAGLRWLTFYDTDLDPERGQQNLSNLVYDRDLSALDAAAKDHGLQGMWSSPWGCEVNRTRVFGEPYCSGPTGLWKGWGGSQQWTVGADWVVSQVVSRPHVAALFLGDEPEMWGVAYGELCQLAEYLKAALLRAGRRDVFVYYNDTPNSQALKLGLCKGLDFFSIDACEWTSPPCVDFRSLIQRRCL